MKQSSRDLIIPFVGLKPGLHDFRFHIDKTFFEDQENTLISDGEVIIDLQLEKKETMLVAHFSIHGHVNTVCDRCSDPLEVPVEGHYRLVYKFGTGVSDDENLIILPPETYELDVRNEINELITISLPARVLHEEGECNPEMMELYEKFVVNPEDEDDEDWDDEDWDDEDWDDDEEEDSDDDEPENGPDKPIDPRWSALKNLN